MVRPWRVIRSRGAPLDQPVRSVFTSTGRTIVAPSIDESRRDVILINSNSWVIEVLAIWSGNTKL